MAGNDLTIMWLTNSIQAAPNRSLLTARHWKTRNKSQLQVIPKSPCPLIKAKAAWITKQNWRQLLPDCCWSPSKPSGLSLMSQCLLGKSPTTSQYKWEESQIINPRCVWPCLFHQPNASYIPKHHHYPGTYSPCFHIFPDRSTVNYIRSITKNLIFTILYEFHLTMIHGDLYYFGKVNPI